MTLVQDIKTCFASNSNEGNSAYMLKYMRFQFDYYGIKSPIRKAISKPFIAKTKTMSKDEIKQLTLELWNAPQRELQLLALDIAIPYFKKNSDIEDISFFLILAQTKPWWDTVDFIASKLIGNYFLTFPDMRKKYTNDWIKSGNKWLIRCAILFQLKYKDETDLKLLFDTILSTCHTNEFFINKAIGWILRQNAKRIPDEILTFVNSNQSKLSDLSRREALKHFTN